MNKILLILLSLTVGFSAHLAIADNNKKPSSHMDKKLDNDKCSKPYQVAYNACKKACKKKEGHAFTDCKKQCKTTYNKSMKNNCHDK